MVVVAPDEGDERRLRGLEGDTWVGWAGNVGTPSKAADPGKAGACCWFRDREGELVVVDVLIRLEVGGDDMVSRRRPVDSSAHTHIAALVDDQEHDSGGLFGSVDGSGEQ